MRAIVGVLAIVAVLVVVSQGPHRTVPVILSGTAMPAMPAQTDLRAQIVAYARSRQGDPYVSGARAEGGSDCSGFTQLVFRHVAGVDIGATTFSQWPTLCHIDPSQVRPGDLWFGRWNDSGDPNSEHTGIVVAVNADGTMDLVHNGADLASVHVTRDFLHTSLGDHTLGFARAIPEE